jgi:hypothetical protein
MEINYELIIKYLCPKKTFEKDGVTLKGQSNFSVNFPEKFKNIFSDKFYRYGIQVYDNTKTNISFWSSLLTLINKDFTIPYNTDENQLIVEFKNQVLDMYGKSKLSKQIKKFDKIELREKLKLEPDYIVLQYLADILDMNFIVFDFITFDIMTLYLKEIMNPWNKTVLFSKYNNVWEPIMLQTENNIIKKIFDYNDDIIKKILTGNNIIYYENKKDFIFNDNTTEESVHTESEEKHKNYNKTKLTKMKVNELEELCKSLKIELKVKTTKASMIELILKEVEV